MRYLIVMLLICFFPYTKKELQDITSIESIILPETLTINYPIINEAMYDTLLNVLKDTIILEEKDITLQLGKELKDWRVIDIRTKAIIKYKTGKKESICMDRYGKILYQNKIYSGTRKAKKLLRGMHRTTSR